ncbi:MAG TPA: hypothetical protein VFL87_03915, partial [Thermoleophilaceae bacterium]|nr:hypothetical protein [Thermoleophilaceae bacterium]
DRVQPYNGGDYVLLHALKELHDRDKHRKATVVGGGGIHVATEINRLVFKWFLRMSNVPAFAEDGDPIFEFVGELGSYPDLEFQITPAILFRAGTPVVGQVPVIETLARTRAVIRHGAVEPLERFL